ncbi:hypothetical protein HUU39_18575 [candidate division KSB1 bacterium]|nr:hypothetical protein [bacterium]NUM67248.1 hypothetical protein [candidate division KSB1 bacterium]
MTISTRFCTNGALMVFVLLSTILQGCHPKAKNGKVDIYGCNEPPPDVFTAAGVDLKFTQTQFWKVVTGEVILKTDPRVISLASKAMTDERIRSYLRCLAIHRDKYTPEQATYLEQMYLFMNTQPPPTPVQFKEWQNSNPFPTSSGSINIEDSPGATAQYMINSPNSVQFKLDNLIIVQDIEDTQKQSFFLNIHKLDAEPNYIIEMRPGLGSWAPFFCAVPAEEVAKTRYMSQVTIMRGSKNRLPTRLLIFNTHFTPSNDKKWMIAWTDAEATPTQSYYAFFRKLPSKIAFGALDGPARYVVDIQNWLEIKK